MRHQGKAAERWASAELVHHALLGDKTAADRLISAIWPACFRFAASLTGDWNLANDAAQEACVIVHNRIRTLRDAAAFDAWLYRILIRESRRVMPRHAAAESPAPLAESQPDATVGIDVWRALARLQPLLREVVVLFYFDDFKSHEIADTLGIPHATVRKRLTRARERLRALLGDYGDDWRSGDEEDHQHAL
jgi:RNA polymerase sigma-70 factor (ECF subfamily)